MSITKTQITQARKTWGDALVAISKSFEEGGIEDARRVADDFIDAAYGYADGDVLFKPTMASGDQTFRLTKEGALSYFVGHDDNFPLDGGFGLKGWRSVQFDTASTFVDGETALWMGNVTLTDKDGGVTTVDKSFGYRSDANGVLRIVLHHSSLPYLP